MSPAPPPEEAEEDEDEDGPPPQPFKPAKNLANVPKPDEFEVKSGASGAPASATPTPSGADVRRDRPPPRPPVKAPRADEGPVDVRLPGASRRAPPSAPRAPDEFSVVKPTMDPSKLPRFQDPGKFDVVKSVIDPSKLPRFKEPGPFDVVLPVHTPSVKPKPEERVDLEEPDVVIDHSQHPVELGADGRPVGGSRRIGIVDTTFARFNMGDAAEQELHKLGEGFEVLRRTVPGIKDLPVECKILLERFDCDLVLACGMVGRMPVDKTCAHEASLAIQWAMLATNRHILEAFVHEDEARDEKQLAWLMDRRTREHAENAWALLFDPDRLRRNAGRGLRQGFEDAGPVRLA